MKLRASHQLNRFGGIDNVNQPDEMEQINDIGHTYYFQKIDNFDLTNKGHLRRRDGYRVHQTFVGQTLHSLWSDGQDCFFMLDDGLCRLNSDLSKTVLLSGFGSLAMNYVSMYGKVFFTNSEDIGWIDSDGVASLPSTTDNFKSVMPAGQLIETYNNCLYVAKGNILYCSDPTFPTQYDYRYGLIPFLSRITMLRAVSDGLWISDSNDIYFLNGSTHFDFATVHRASYPVIERSAVTIDGRYLGTDSFSKSVIMFTKEGICLGGAEGQFLNLTEGRYHGVDNFIVLDAAIRITNESYQYIVVGYDTLLDQSLNVVSRLEVPESTDITMSTTVA